MNTWESAFKARRFRIQFAITSLTLVLLALVMPFFFEHVIHNKSGVFLNDWVLNSIKPRDVSWVIFGLIYSCIVVFAILNFSEPGKILFALSLYSYVTWLRLLTIYVFTVEAPTGIIPLKDPFLAFFVYNKPDFVKDLFFSGHVSTLVTLGLTETNKKIKAGFFLIAAITGFLLLIQHVHYTLDVVFAPFFTYLIYVTLKSFSEKTIFNLN